MSDRIFSNGWENLGGEAETQKVDWSRVAQTMDTLQGKTLPAAKPRVKTASKDVGRKTPERVEKFAKVEMCEECGVPHPCTHDLVAAKLAGDEGKYASLIEQRKNRRNAAIERYESMEREAAVAERSNLRRAIYAALEQEEGLVAEAKCKCGKGGDCKCASDDKPKKGKAKNGFCFDCRKSGDACTCDKEPMEKETCKASKSTDGFVSVSALDDKQRQVFAAFADRHGWPKEYVEAMFSKSTEVELPEAFRKVASSKLAEADKRDIVTSMYKEAKLTSEQASRIKDYWKNELGYQDAEWIDDLVAEPAKE